MPSFEATLTDRQIDMLQELGYLPVIMRQYGEECANPLHRWTSVSMAFADDALFSRSKEDAHAVHPSTD